MKQLLVNNDTVLNTVQHKQTSKTECKSKTSKKVEECSKQLIICKLKPKLFNKT